MQPPEKELPFDITEDTPKQGFAPSFYDQSITTDLMKTYVSPFEVKTSIHNCFACDVADYKKPLELSRFDASLMVVGERPEDVDLSTPSGKMLMDTLRWAGFDIEDIYFTSLSKCVSTATPEKCQHHLVSELLCVRPKMVIALGYDVGKHFDPSISSAGYQSVLMSTYDMVTTYTTSYATSQQSLFHEFCAHIQQAKQRADSKR